MENNISEIARAGMCSVCGSPGGCTHQQEFKGADFPRETLMNKEAVRALAKKPAEYPSDILYSSLKGLCMNCDRAGTCSIQKPETGIWFCEDYL